MSLFDFASGDGVQFAEYDDDDDGEADDAFGFGHAGGFDDFAGGFDDDDTAAAPDETGAALALRLEENEQNAGLEWVVNASLGGKMAWAGPSHWRFKASTSRRAGFGNGDAGDEEGAEDGANKSAKPRREKGALTYDLENPGEPDEARFTLAATAEELLLVAAPTAVDTLLPPDLGYDPSDLARLPSPERLRHGAGGGREARGGGGEGFGGDDDDGGFGGGLDGDDDDFGFGGSLPGLDPDASSAPGADGLVAAPRRVEKISVNYTRSTKQVDVKELKCALWENVNSSATSAPDPETGARSFHALLETFPEDNLAGATEDISVHMAFICMLHLANEHGLKITDRPSLNDLDISNLPARGGGGVKKQKKRARVPAGAEAEGRGPGRAVPARVSYPVGGMDRARKEEDATDTFDEMKHARRMCNNRPARPATVVEREAPGALLSSLRSLHASAFFFASASSFHVPLVWFMSALVMSSLEHPALLNLATAASQSSAQFFSSRWCLTCDRSKRTFPWRMRICDAREALSPSIGSDLFTASFSLSGSISSDSANFSSASVNIASVSLAFASAFSPAFAAACAILPRSNACCPHAMDAS